MKKPHTPSQPTPCDAGDTKKLHRSIAPKQHETKHTNQQPADQQVIGSTRPHPDPRSSHVPPHTDDSLTRLIRAPNPDHLSPTQPPFRTYTAEAIPPVAQCKPSPLLPTPHTNEITAETLTTGSADRRICPSTSRSSNRTHSEQLLTSRATQKPPFSCPFTFLKFRSISK